MNPWTNLLPLQIGGMDISKLKKQMYLLNCVTYEEIKKKSKKKSHICSFFFFQVLRDSFSSIRKKKCKKPEDKINLEQTKCQWQ